MVFHGAATGTPLIATLAREHGILLNILSASTRCMEDKLYGSMILSVPETGCSVEEVLQYIREIPDIAAEEV